MSGPRGERLNFFFGQRGQHKEGHRSQGRQGVGFIYCLVHQAVAYLWILRAQLSHQSPFESFLTARKNPASWVPIRTFG